MDMESESWLRKPHSGMRQDNNPHLRRALSWRRSGDQSYWENLAAQVERPPRAARPHSCIEGQLKEDWLQTLEQAQAHPLQQQVPAFVDHTVSMPALPSKVIPGSFYHQGYPYLQRSVRTPSISPSFGEGSLSSLESLESHSGLETRDRARIRTGPTTQKAKVCCVAPVRIGWLPVRRRVVMTDSPNNLHRHDNSTSQVKLKPPITPVVHFSSVRANGSEPGAKPSGHSDGTSGSGVRITTGAQRPWRITVPSTLQTAGKGGHTPVERDYKQTAGVAASQDSELQPDGLMWKTPVQRRGSTSHPTSVTVPPAGEGSVPKHSSSISSITITSRRIVRTSSLPASSTPPCSGERADCSKAVNNHTANPATYLNDQHPRQMTQRRKVLAVKVTEQRGETITVFHPNVKNVPIDPFSLHPNGTADPSNLTTIGNADPPVASTENTSAPAPFSKAGSGNRKTDTINISSKDNHFPIPLNLASPDTQQPVVLRRKPTIVKLLEHRESYGKEGKSTVGRAAFRHSYTEGLQNTNSLTHTSNPSYANIKLLAANKASPSGSEIQEFSFLEQRDVDKGPTQLHRSLLDLQLFTTSSNAPSLKNTQTTEGQVPSSASASKDPEFRRMSSALSRKTNIDPVSSAGSSLNRRWSTGEATGSHDEAYLGRVSSTWDVGQREKGSALLGCQPLTLIKVPESSAHATHDAIMAMNAAAVIANIKLQTQQRKRAQTCSSSTMKETEAPSQSTTTVGHGGEKLHNGEGAAGISLQASETGAITKRWHAEFVPFETTKDASHIPDTISKALEQRRPDFIKRSQARVRAVEQRTQDRRQLENTHIPVSFPASAQAQKDSIFNSNQNVSEKQMQQLLRRNYSNLPEVKRRKDKEKRKKEEEKRKLVTRTNRLKAEIFKKKVLDHVLRRGKD